MPRRKRIYAPKETFFGFGKNATVQRIGYSHLDLDSPKFLQRLSKRMRGGYAILRRPLKKRK